MSYQMNNDQGTVERLSQQRDDIYEYVVGMFRVHMENDDIDNAMALADEFYEWMDPDQLEDEVTAFFDEHELRNLYQSKVNE
jgi:hypothetical protein